MKAQLTIVGLAIPRVLIFRPIVHEEQHAGGGKALDEAIEKRLRLAIDPLKILENDQHRLYLAFDNKQALQRIERAPTPLRWVQGKPFGVLDRHIEERKQGNQGGIQAVPDNLPRHFL